MAKKAQRIPAPVRNVVRWDKNVVTLSCGHKLALGPGWKGLTFLKQFTCLECVPRG